jgi:aminopeptidase N
MNDKIEFDISFRDVADKAYITNGSFTYQEKDYGVVDYNFDMKQPISSYLVALVSGDYTLKKQTATSGVPLEYYYYPKDSLNVESTYRYSKEIFDFLEQEIGVPYPWQVYKQVPVKDFLYAGMENASCTIFSDDFMVDAIGFNDRNYVNVNAHELAHQWFGDLVTETKSDHHWLHEGFATYYALLAEREIFGEDYFYYKLFESAEQLRALSDQGKGQKLVAAGGSSLTYYQKGAWAVHILKELVGEEAFAKAVKAYLTKHAYQNVTTADFMTEVAAVTQVDLDPFKKNWLYQSAFQAQDALESLKKSPFMRSYFELQAGRTVPIAAKFEALSKAIDSGNEYLGQEAVYQLAGEPITSVLPAYKKALATNNVFVRQAIATSIEQLPQELVLVFYDLLEDASYVTREQAFIKLWVYHQQQGDIKEQQELLEKMSNQFGFADGNIRTLWLTLSLATPDYKPQESLNRYQELIGYTDPSEPFKLRQNAFQYLLQLNSFEEVSLRNLLEACVHHTWRFRESARGMLQEVLKNPKIKEIVTRIKDSLPEKEQEYLDRTL